MAKNVVLQAWLAGWLAWGAMAESPSWPQVDGISGASYALPSVPRPVEQVRSVISDWLETHWFMSLATVDENGSPSVAGLTFYVEDMVVYFRTARASTKAQHIKSNPAVSYTVWDNVDDMSELKALQVLGRARFLEGEERDRIAAILAGAPGSTRSNLERFFAQKGIKRQYQDRPFDETTFVVIAVDPKVARFNDNTVSMGHSDTYRFD